MATPGDLLLHIRHERMDMCFEFATQVMGRLAGAATVVDEVHGFRFFDERDLLGFVDGTENPVGVAASTAALVGGEDPAFAGGSYVIVQKYLHDMHVVERPGGGGPGDRRSGGPSCPTSRCPTRSSPSTPTSR